MYLKQSYSVCSANQCWFVNCLLSAYNKIHVSTESEYKLANLYLICPRLIIAKINMTIYIVSLNPLKKVVY